VPAATLPRPLNPPPWRVQDTTCDSASAQHGALQQACLRLHFFLFDTLGRLYTGAMFDILMAYPDTAPAVQDCAECLKRTSLHQYFVDTLSDAVRSRLLHPGACMCPITKERSGACERVCVCVCVRACPCPCTCRGRRRRTRMGGVFSSQIRLRLCMRTQSAICPGTEHVGCGRMGHLGTLRNFGLDT
jgi:hypothetical protein